MSAGSGTKAFPRSVKGTLSEPNGSDNHEILWNDFKTKVLKVSKCCLRDTRRTFKSFLTKETLNIVEENRRARFEGSTGQYRELKRELQVR